MATSKYKIHDKVVIVNNSLQPQYQGKVGSVKKVYAAFSDTDSEERKFFYRIEVAFLLISLTQNVLYKHVPQI